MAKGERVGVVVDCSSARSVGMALTAVVLQLRPGERLTVEALPTALHVSVWMPGRGGDGLVVSCGGISVSDREREERASVEVVEGFCANFWRLLTALGAVSEASRNSGAVGGPELPPVVS